jgi:glycosyltransferase involved in cell wall biosynthesis
MKKAVIAVISDLTTDMRVSKLALLMAEEGLEVSVIGRLSGYPLPPAVPGIKATRLWVPFRKGPAMYLCFNLFLFFRLLFKRSEIIVACDLDTLVPCYLVSRLFRKKLVYDSHEYFTGQYGLEERRIRHFIWKSAERLTVPRIKYMITVSDSIADLYRREYGVDPVVVRNVAPDVSYLRPRERSELGATDNELLMVCQGSGINPGRGGEELIRAMAMTTGVRLLMIGSGDAIEGLRRIATESPARDRIIFLPRMPYEEMMRYTMCCDAGLSADTDTCINQRYSLPNKLFDYIAAGIPAVVSPLPEVTALVEHYGCGTVLEEVTPDAIAGEIRRLADNPVLLHALRERSRAARQELTWEKEKLREQELIRSVIESKSFK